MKSDPQRTPAEDRTCIVASMRPGLSCRALDSGLGLPWELKARSREVRKATPPRVYPAKKSRGVRSTSPANWANVNITGDTHWRCLLLGGSAADMPDLFGTVEAVAGGGG